MYNLFIKIFYIPNKKDKLEFDMYICNCNVIDVIMLIIQMIVFRPRVVPTNFYEGLTYRDVIKENFDIYTCKINLDFIHNNNLNNNLLTNNEKKLIKEKIPLVIVNPQFNNYISSINRNENQTVNFTQLSVGYKMKF